MAGNSANVGGVYVALGLNAANFFEGVKEAQGAAKGLGAKLQGAMPAIAAVGAAAAAAGAAFVGFGMRAMESADRIGDAAQRLGTTALAFQQLESAAARAGAAPGVLEAGLDKLNNGLGEFIQTGKGPAADAFERLGLSARIASGEIGSADEAFYAIADAMAGVESPAERARLATELMGRSAGPELLEVLAHGGDALRGFGQDATDAGRHMSDEMIARLPELKIRIDEASRGFEQFATIAAGETLLALEELGTALQPLWDYWHKVGTEVARVVGPALQQVGEAFGRLAAGPIGQSMVPALQTLGGIVGGLVGGVLKGLLETLAGLIDLVDRVARAVVGMASAVGDAMGRMGRTLQGGIDRVRDLTGAFFQMERRVTGNSYVPDMVDAIIANFARLERDGWRPLDRKLRAAADGFSESSRQIVRDVQEAVAAARELGITLNAGVATRANLGSADAAGGIVQTTGGVGPGRLNEINPWTGKPWDDKASRKELPTADAGREAADATRDWMRDVFQEGGRALASGNFGDWLRSTAQRLAGSVLDRAMSALADAVMRTAGGSSGGGGGGRSGGWLSSLFQWGVNLITGGRGGTPKITGKSLPRIKGFQTGGSLKVGGSGGLDSQLVAFRATPGERVRIDRPGSGGGDGGPSQIVIPVSVGGQALETIIVNVSRGQALAVTAAAVTGADTVQRRQRAYSKFRGNR